MNSRHNLLYIVESGTDVRVVEALAERFSLQVLARRISGGVEISQQPATEFRIAPGPASRLAFAWFVIRHLTTNRKNQFPVLVQGYGVAALAANITGRLFGFRVFMLVCSPIEIYFQCRRTNPLDQKKFSRLAWYGLRVLARLNACLGREYVAISRYLADVIRSHGAKGPIHIIPVYGVDMSRFGLPKISKTVLRKQQNIPTDGYILFFSSRIAPEKDPVTLLKAFRTLLSEGMNVWLLHRSGGYQEFLTLADQYEVKPRVIATDAVHPYHELPYDYQAIDVCVQASLEEGLGFSPLEALACGTPVVAASVGGIQETIIDGVTGWCYPPRNVNRLVDCLREVLTNSVEVARRVKAGRDMVLEKYESRKVFDRLQELLG